MRRHAKAANDLKDLENCKRQAHVGTRRAIVKTFATPT
jgi:hypothetical protein